MYFCPSPSLHVGPTLLMMDNHDIDCRYIYIIIIIIIYIIINGIINMFTQLILVKLAFEILVLVL